MIMEKTCLKKDESEHGKSLNGQFRKDNIGNITILERNNLETKNSEKNNLNKDNSESEYLKKDKSEKEEPGTEQL